MDFTDMELFHMSMAMSFFYEPNENCEVCEVVKHKIFEEIRKRSQGITVECTEGLCEKPVPEWMAKLGVTKIEVEHIRPGDEK